MTDLIERLRKGEAPLDDPNLNDEAADEIEQLRAALEASQTWLYGHDNAEGQAERRRLNAEVLTPTAAAPPTTPPQ